jgi:hypothetical protein
LLLFDPLEEAGAMENVFAFNLQEFFVGLEGGNADGAVYISKLIGILNWK